jgi:alginate O-acetyltransferase complex protein AlgI
MLFNSFEFILAFLPITLIGFFFAGRFNKTAGAIWLFAASLIFYGWWDVKYIWLLLGSIGFHFYVGQWIAATEGAKRKYVLIFSIALDLAALIYFKYTDMFIRSWNDLSTSQIETLNIILPLGISFFTFTQIAYLVDTYENKVRETRHVHFGLFVTYFPHLIAGPVLHHKEMMPQFVQPSTYRVDWEKIAVGFSIFVLGLSKKVLIADNIAVFVPVGFTGLDKLELVTAWLGVLAYTFQLYFDFSGYSDMAVGLSLMFGIKLPINFYSPYKSTSISEFWRRWHMTLSRFLRDYLYIRLGGNRKGKTRRYLNLITTMFLGGLWHGAGWNFALWGLLHGAYLCIHEGWRASIGKRLNNLKGYSKLSLMITFIAVVFAWVPFRATNLSDTFLIWKAMLGLSGAALPDVYFNLSPMLTELITSLGFREGGGGGNRLMYGTVWIIVAGVIAFAAPNSSQIFAKFDHAIIDNKEESRNISPISFRFSSSWAFVISSLLLISCLYLGRPSEFLYFQF